MQKKNKQNEKIKSPVAVKSKGRPPVVAILGHVDHGKTTLLDNIRKSHVAQKEAGGITQHIGAYQIIHKNRKITFIDTPGHEAFSAMRARSGSVSDLVILIVAADDGLMPQTRESIAHIKAAGVPFIVVVNKIDLPGVNTEKIKKQLAEENVLVEGYGGDVVMVSISAKNGQGIDNLLEMINLITDIQGLENQDDKEFEGTVIETKLDKFKGVVATILVKRGVLRIGDLLHTLTVMGKVKSLIDAEGKRQKEASTSTPVEVLGFSKVPKIGEKVDSKTASEVKTNQQKVTIDTAQKFKRSAENEVRLIIKGDVAGSLEAIENALQNLKKENQNLKIFYSSTGNISESDVLLASATKSLIIGFNVSISNSAEKLASEEGVLVRNYNVIYELLDELKEGLEALSKQEEKEKFLGEAKILQIFKRADSKVAGSKVISGRINKNDLIAIKRENKEIGRSNIASMKHRDTDINEASKDDELGIILEKDVPFAKGDIIVAIGSDVSK